MQTILVLNSKGGCGKTTLASNLASFFSIGGTKTALMDHDPQGSSLQWLSLREGDRPHIQGIDASRTRSGLTRTWQMAVAPGTERLIMDAPAGISGQTLQDMVRRTDVIVIPVAPSPIDIHATSEFVRDLLIVGKIRKYGIRVGVVANRVRRETPHYEPLKRFLSGLDIPFVTSLADTDNFILASEIGLGVYELDEAETMLEREQFMPLINWLAYPDAVSRYNAGRGVCDFAGAARG